MVYFHLKIFQTNIRTPLLAGGFCYSGSWLLCDIFGRYFRNNETYFTVITPEKGLILIKSTLQSVALFLLSIMESVVVPLK